MTAHDFKGPARTRKNRRWGQTRVYSAVGAEPSGRLGLMMRMEVKEDTSQMKCSGNTVEKQGHALNRGSCIKARAIVLKLLCLRVQLAKPHLQSCRFS